MFYAFVLKFDYIFETIAYFIMNANVQLHMAA